MYNKHRDFVFHKVAVNVLIFTVIIEKVLGNVVLVDLLLVEKVIINTVRFIIVVYF